jgi:hypothetical protein
VVEFDLRGDVSPVRSLANHLGLFGRKVDLEVVNEPELPLVAKIESLAYNSPVPELGRFQTESPGEVCRQIGLGFLNGQTEIGDADRHVRARGLRE